MPSKVKMNYERLLSKEYEHVLFLLSFVTASILGSYARFGVSRLANYEPSYVSSGSVLWSNLTSSMLMGMFQIFKIHDYFEARGLAPFFGVVTTGFCGTFSSYSSMMLETFLNSTSLTISDLAQGSKLPNRAYGILEFLSTILANLFISTSAYLFGRELAAHVVVPLTSDIEEPEDKLELSKRVPKLWVHRTLQVVHALFILMAIPLTALFIVLACVYDNSSQGIWTLPPLFAIAGSYIRFELSNWLNGINKDFPIGTFTANQLGSLLIAVFQIIYRGRRNFGDDLTVARTVRQCRVITGLTSGFSGGLSTISTFINEGYRLGFTDMLIYYATSVAVSYSLIVIILGSYAWTRGLTSPLC